MENQYDEKNRKVGLGSILEGSMPTIPVGCAKPNEPEDVCATLSHPRCSMAYIPCNAFLVQRSQKRNRSSVLF